MEEAGVDWRKWAFIIACISLFWNFCNSIFTVVVNESSKRRTVVLDEFRSTVRDPVRQAVDGLTPIIPKLRDAVSSASDTNSLRAAIAPVNREVVSQLGQISDALTDANTSRFADGDAWLDKFDVAQDDILMLFDKALNPSRTEDDMRDAIGFIPIRIRKMRSAIISDLDRQVERLS